MRSSLDSVVYLNGKVTCAGWAAPEMAGDEVCLTIRKEDGSILDAQVSRVKRADVGQVIYQDASFDKYGLLIAISMALRVVFADCSVPKALKISVSRKNIWILNQRKKNTQSGTRSSIQGLLSV